MFLSRGLRQKVMKCAVLIIVLSLFISGCESFQSLRAHSTRLAKRSSRVHLLPQLQQIATSIGPSVDSFAGSLQSNIALADEAVSLYSKVDKTGFIGFFATYIEEAIDFGQRVVGSYGVAIILFTVLVKILTLPLTTAQLESTTKIQKLAPMQKKIQEVYAEDEATKNQMVAQLFQAAKVNPLAGCLPALVQIPVFISLYRALTNLVAENKLGEAFLWIPSLEGPVYSRSAAEAGVWIKSIFGGNPLLGWHDTAAYLSLPLILFVSQTISQKLLQPPRDPTRTLSEQEEASQAVINYLPLIVAFFSINVPAGLSVYWIVNNILTTVVTVAVKNSLQGGDFPAEVAALMSRVESSVRGKSGGGSSSRRSMGGSLSSDPENSAASRPKPAGFGASSRASSSPKMEKAAKTLEEFAARRQAESSSASASSATDQEDTDKAETPQR